MGEQDPDEWVQVAATIVKDYPDHFEIDQQLGKVTSHFQETVQEIVSEGIPICKTLLKYAF